MTDRETVFEFALGAEQQPMTPFNVARGRLFSTTECRLIVDWHFIPWDEVPLEHLHVQVRRAALGPVVMGPRVYSLLKARCVPTVIRGNGGDITLHSRLISSVPLDSVPDVLIREMLDRGPVEGVWHL